MMPRAFVKRRAPSPRAICQRPGCDCGSAPLTLHVTASPLTDYAWLVIERCPVKIAHLQGVPTDVPEPRWDAEDENEDSDTTGWVG